jgi:hypothetical protein
MRMTFEVEGPEREGSTSGPVTVGWLIPEVKGSIIYDAPERVRSPDMSRTHAKSASRCPALLNLESRYFEVKCPFDLNLGVFRDEQGKPLLKNLSSDASAIRNNKLRDVITVVEEREWRYKDRPTIQLKLPYVFISDEHVYLSQTAPFLSYAEPAWPGTIFGGRYPINVWPRPLMWAFEWHDVAKPLVLKRGQPLFYVTFETLPQDRPVQLVEAELTKELGDYLESLSGVVNYVNQTFGLFKKAEERRPRHLLTPRTKR